MIPGEAECLAVALQRGYRFLSDDFAARRLAKVKGIIVSGTIGILLKKRRNHQEICVRSLRSSAFLIFSRTTQMLAGNTVPRGETMTGRLRACLPFLLLIVLLAATAGIAAADPPIAGHTVVLDGQGKIIPWYSPAANAYDEFLDRRWNFIKTSVPPSPGPAPRSNYPQYYFYDGFVTTQTDITPDNWMNDVGEKIPNWFESARLYYAYTGDASVMTIVRGLIDYTIDHGTSPANFAWPNFPHTTANHGELEFDGFTPNFAAHEVQVDHAGEMGLTYLHMYQFFGDQKYLTAAINVADVLAAHARVGTATQSVWPYRVRLDTGAITAQYGANWIGSYALLDELITAGLGNTSAYAPARTKARDFILNFPMQTGYWTDGHSDNPVNSNTYKSNLSKSNTALYMYDHPEFDPNWQTHLPMLIQWTVDNFVTRTTGGEPATAYGADIVGEQDGFLYQDGLPDGAACR